MFLKGATRAAVRGKDMRASFIVGALLLSGLAVAGSGVALLATIGVVAGGVQDATHCAAGAGGATVGQALPGTWRETYAICSNFVDAADAIVAMETGAALPVVDAVGTNTLFTARAIASYGQSASQQPPTPEQAAAFAVSMALEKQQALAIWLNGIIAA